jgi:hypothetical protein
MAQGNPSVKVRLVPDSTVAGAEVRVEVEIGGASADYNYRVVRSIVDEGTVQPSTPKQFPADKKQFPADKKKTLTFLWDTRDLTVGHHSIHFLVAADGPDPENGPAQTVWKRAQCAVLTIRETAPVQALVTIEDCPEGAVVLRGALVCLTAEAIEPETHVDYQCIFEGNFGTILGDRIEGCEYKWQAFLPTHRMAEGEQIVTARILPAGDKGAPEAESHDLEVMTVKELQALAGKLGITSSKMKKSDLIKAIAEEDPAQSVHHA